MATHGMIDLETLDTKPSCTVLSLGAIKFNPLDDSEPHSELYLKINVDDQDRLGRTTSDDTIAWWAKQDPKAMEEAFDQTGAVSVDEALRQVSKWSVGVDTIWCQGPAFDIVILENLFRQYNHHIPWPFWKIRDSRTLFGIMPVDPRKATNFAAHNALEDCKVQALCVQQTLQQLQLKVK